MRSTMLIAAALLLAPAPLLSQAAAAAPSTAHNTAVMVRDELIAQFNSSMQKFIALAEAMPADRFLWKPHPDAMPVGHVYAHVANYNFYYPQSAMRIPAPAGLKLDTLEAIRDKAQLVALLKASAQHVRSNVARMDAAALETGTRLYGRNQPTWAVLVQLVAHMNEHLGQSIAYARANSIVPPWSQ